MSLSTSKHLVARSALSSHLLPLAAPSSIGIGSGSTIAILISHLAAHPSSQHHTFIPTSYQSRELLDSAGLRIGSIDTLQGPLALAFDGADAFDSQLNAIKGGGACLFQEKLVAVHAARFVVLVDWTKRVSSLRERGAGVPVEVVPMAARYVLAELNKMGCVGARVREAGAGKVGPVVTDGGNFVVDAPFPQGLVSGGGRSQSASVVEVSKAVKAVLGVVEHGVFSRLDRKADEVHVAMQDGSVEVITADGEEEDIDW